MVYINYMGRERDNFELKEGFELPEELDYKNLKLCPHCGKPIPRNAAMCMYCGEPVYSNTRKKWVIFVAIFIIVAFLLFVLF